MNKLILILIGLLLGTLTTHAQICLSSYQPGFWWRYL